MICTKTTQNKAFIHRKRIIWFCLLWNGISFWLHAIMYLETCLDISFILFYFLYLNEQRMCHRLKIKGKFFNVSTLNWTVKRRRSHQLWGISGGINIFLVWRLFSLLVFFRFWFWSLFFRLFKVWISNCLLWIKFSEEKQNISTQNRYQWKKNTQNYKNITIFSIRNGY